MLTSKHEKHLQQNIHKQYIASQVSVMNVK